MNTQIALSIEKMQRLKEIGVDTSVASMRYERFGSYVEDPMTGLVVWKWGEWNLCVGYNSSSNAENYQVKPAFTLQDILYALPNSIYIKEYDRRYYLTISALLRIEYYRHCDNTRLYMIEHSYRSLLDAAYDMLCLVTENGYYKKGL